MAENQARAALHESVTQDMVRAAAWDLHWNWQDVFAAGPNNPYQIEWSTDDQTTVYYFEDHLINVHYLLAKGPNAEQTISRACAKLKCYDWAGILKRWESSAGDTRARVQTIYFAAIAAPQGFDREVFAFFEKALKDGEPDVRLAVIVAAGYVGWREFKDLLRRLSENDPDEEVRQNAARMLEGLELHGQ